MERYKLKLKRKKNIISLRGGGGGWAISKNNSAKATEKEN